MRCARHMPPAACSVPTLHSPHVACTPSTPPSAADGRKVESKKAVPRSAPPPPAYATGGYSGGGGGGGASSAPLPSVPNKIFIGGTVRGAPQVSPRPCVHAGEGQAPEHRRCGTTAAPVASKQAEAEKGGKERAAAREAVRDGAARKRCVLSSLPGRESGRSGGTVIDVPSTCGPPGLPHACAGRPHRGGAQGALWAVRRPGRRRGECQSPPPGGEHLCTQRCTGLTGHRAEHACTRWPCFADCDQPRRLHARLRVSCACPGHNRTPHSTSLCISPVLVTALPRCRACTLSRVQVCGVQGGGLTRPLQDGPAPGAPPPPQLRCRLPARSLLLLCTTARGGRARLACARCG